jgi:hypothetical protein
MPEGMMYDVTRQRVYYDCAARVSTTIPSITVTYFHSISHASYNGRLAHRDKGKF